MRAIPIQRSRVLVGATMALTALFIAGIATPAFADRPVIVAQSTSPSALTDDEVKELLIRQSLAGYPGSCPCPYNRAKNGSKCGRRSAYSRPGGYAPLCYPEDITPTMIENFRARQNRR
tara:strand:+ start:7110 stop:7466 length:357 start_codon:yes stop_codon:yes gene_type:complete